MGVSSDLFLEKQFDDWVDSMSGDFDDYDLEYYRPKSRNTDFYIKAVGVTYGNRQDVIKTLKVGDILHFVPEENNIYDKNAVLIVTELGKDIGYVSKDYNKDILQSIKEGVVYKLVVSNITGAYDFNNLGVNIKVSVLSNPQYTTKKQCAETKQFIINNNILEKYMGNSKTVVIPNGVTIIGEKAFSGWPIEEITIPEGLKEIRKSAFSHCKNLEKINFPSTINHIDDYAFDDCINLKAIVLPEKLEVIGISTFSSCTSLEQIVLPIKLREIKAAAFSRCKSLKEIYFNNNLYSIGHNAFKFCDSLTTVCIPKNVAVIGEYVFSDCKNLKNAKILSDIVSIGGNPFFNCNNLKTIVFSESVKDYFRRNRHCSTCGGTLYGFIFKECLDCKTAGRF